MVDGQKLLALFAVLMIVVGALMLRGRGAAAMPGRLIAGELPQACWPRLATGALSGFFGIGGGFLIVPGLIIATGMPILFAIGSSLVAVTAFGLTTACNYACRAWSTGPCRAVHRRRRRWRAARRPLGEAALRSTRAR